MLEKSKRSSSTTEAAYKKVREELVRMYGEGSEKVATFDAAVQEHAPNAFNTIKSGAEEADKKTSGFDGTFVGMIGKLAVQLLSLAGLGTGFENVGTKAEDSQDGVKNLDSTIGGFISNIATHVSDALTKSTTLGENIPKGMKNGIEAQEDPLERAIKSTLIGNPQNTLTHGWMINSPSKVTYGYGENIVAGMKNAISNRGGTIVDAIKTVMNNMKNAITGQYDDFKSKGETLAGQFKTGLKSVSFSSVASSWKRTLDMSDLEDTLYDAGHDAARALADGLDSVSMPTLSYYVSDWDYHDLGDGNYSSTPIYSPQWYANGGFPNMGELFVANENGIEMMGRMGHRNVVANNQQITDGIKAAVVDGMMEVFMATNGANDELPYQFNIKMVTPDGEVLAQQVERGKARRDARFNTVGYSYG